MGNDIIDKIIKYLSVKPVMKAWLFGSFSRGEEKDDSDVDIIVKFDPEANVSLLEHVGMQMDLQDILGRDVDLVSEGTFFPWVKDSVDNDKKLIYERKTA